MQHHELIGKTLVFEYTSDTYRIEVLSNARLHWTQLRGDTPGKGDDEDYVYSLLSDDLGLITWIEADGLGLSSVIDFATGRLVTHANQGRDVFVNAGTVRPG